MLTCVAWDCWEEIAFGHYYFPFMPVYKFLEDFFLD